MLVIRQSQLDAIESVLVMPRFEAAMREHVASFHPAWMAGRDAVEVDEFIRAGVARAKRHGATATATYGLFLDLTLEFGQEFDDSGEHPWAEQCIRATPRGDARIRRLFDAAIGFVNQRAALKEREAAERREQALAEDDSE